MAFLTWIGDALRWLVGWILPFFAKAKDFKGIGTVLRWTIHIVLVLGIIIGLWYVQYSSAFVQGFLVRGGDIMRKHLWLPALFVLIYLLSWLGWWLWRLLQTEEGPEFPDITTAWQEAVAALNAQGIDLTEAPLFLVLGLPAGGETSLFEATRMSLGVQNAPQRPDAPLHVFANRDAIFVTCAGASLLGRQSAYLAEEPGFDMGDGGGPAAANGPGGGFDESMASIGFKSIGVHSVGMAGAGMEEIQAILRQAAAERRTTTEAEKQRIEMLMGGGKAAGVRPRKARRQLLRDTEEAARLTARLEYLCRLIVADRNPFCPLNGLLVVVPFAATDGDEDANHTADVCRRDLESVRRAARVQCPMLVLLGDMERVTGFADLVQRFPKDERQNRFGRSFPLVPDLDPAKVSQRIESIPSWVVNSLLTSRVYKFLRLEKAARGESERDAVETNYRLLTLVHRMRERDKRLGLILARATESETEERMLFAGCYLGACGTDRDRDQAFIAGVFQKMIQNQSYVSWTREALDDEATYQRWAQYGYLTLGACVVAMVAAVAYLFWRRG